MSRRGATTAMPLVALVFAVTLGGAILLLVQAILEVRAGPPGMTVVDGYWVGRLPWTPIGVGMMLFGATALAIIGTVAAWLGAGWLIRALSSIALLCVAFWWALSPFTPYSGACCGLPPPYDPVTVAYSNPQLALELLVAPAVVLTLVLWLARPAPPAGDGSADRYRTVSGA